MRHLYHTYIKGAALIAVMALGVASCADFLEIEPRDMVTEDNFWNEKADIDQMVAGCYASMQSEDFINRCIVWGELRSDNIYPGSKCETDHYDLFQALRENLLSTSQFTKWASFYSVINKCNTIIRMAPVVSEKDPSYRESDVNATIAEMTALRSLCYFYLIRAFKDVPFYRESVQQEDEVHYLAPDSFNYVLGEIIADLEAVKGNAIARYPITLQDNIGQSYNSNCNRITRYGIDAMLCDMYLWSGEYDKCIACADEIINQKRADYKEFYGNQTGTNTSAPTEIQAPYAQTSIPLFQNTESDLSKSFDAIFGTGNSFESIFELSFNSTGKDDTRYVKSSGLGRLYGTGIAAKDDKVGLDVNAGSGYLTARPAIVSDLTSNSKDYWISQYDSRFYNSVRALNNSFGEGTIRKGVARNFNVTKNSETSATLPYVNFESNSFTLSGSLDRNWIFYRLTDVMLMKAEALLMKATDNETAEDTELMHQAFDLIYQVNTRSCTMKSDYLAQNNLELSKRGLMITFLMKERNRELMFEGKRWFDLVRYARREGKTDIVRSNVPSSKASGGGSANSGFASMDYLYWPYNKDEVKVNPNLSQKTIYGNETTEGIEMNK